MIFQAVHRLKRGDIGGLEGLVARNKTIAVETAFLITQDLDGGRRCTGCVCEPLSMQSMV